MFRSPRELVMLPESPVPMRVPVHRETSHRTNGGCVCFSLFYDRKGKENGLYRLAGV